MTHPDDFEAREEEYEWFRNLKRDLDVLERWKEQFNIGGDKREEGNHHVDERRGLEYPF